MGLRGKILSLFFVSFGIFAGVGTYLLFSNLRTGFSELEQAQAIRLSQRLTRNFQTELEHLQTVDSDWSNWDGMYEFVATPDREFAQSSIGEGALSSAQIVFAAVLDKQHQRVFLSALKRSVWDGPAAPSFDDAIADVQRLLALPDAQQGCGLHGSGQGTLLLCWQGIHHSDHSGDAAGTLLLARAVTRAMLAQMRNQSGIDFEVRPIASAPPATAPLFHRTVEQAEVSFSSDSAPVMKGRLLDMTGRPVLDFRIQVPIEIRHYGQQVTLKVILVMLSVSLIGGAALFAAIHFMLIRRLHSLDRQLRAAGNQAGWPDQIAVSAGGDEIAGLGHAVNRLLAVLRQQVKALEALTLTDSLTQIANRRAFEARLGLEKKVQERDRTPLSLLWIDVDHFKLFNDFYGHPDGDQALKALARVLGRSASRPTDLAARIGGEEFAILLPNTSLENAMHVYERLRAELQRAGIPHKASPVADVVTVSVGITQAGAETVEQFVARADRAVYDAKHAGRNQAKVIAAEG
jgi:diguanylate cyclase (GGDEF)-like protein